MSRRSLRAMAAVMAMTIGSVGSALAGTLYVADLTGGSEVPPNSSTATGHANMYLSSDESNLHVKLTVAGFTNTITASHIHLGQPGANGGVVFSIGAFTGSIEADWPLSATDVANLKNGAFYVNVHSNVFPGGEIRGQIGAGLSSSFLAQMTGANEVPPNGSANSGLADVTLHDDGSILHIDLVASGFAPGSISASHIHQGAAGVNGPVVFSIGTFTTRIAKDFTPTPAQVSDLVAGNYYVNIHSSAFPGGEVRGQLASNEVNAVIPVANGSDLGLRAGPNPMRESTTLTYALPAGGAGTVEIFDVAGRSVEVLEARAGAQSLAWNGRDRDGAAVADGVYFARLTSGRGSETVRLSLVR